MTLESCPVCGGDGRISTSYSTRSCPACSGSGRRTEDRGFHDVTKTKPEHHHPAAKKGEKQTGPRTPQGKALAKEVTDSKLPDAAKARLTQSIIDYENKKGEMTKTFSRIVRKEIRAAE